MKFLITLIQHSFLLLLFVKYMYMSWDGIQQNHHCGAIIFITIKFVCNINQLMFATITYIDFLSKFPTPFLSMEIALALYIFSLL